MALTPAATRLRWLIMADAATCLVAAALMVVASALWIDLLVLKVLTALVALCGVVMAVGLLPLSRGRLGSAVAWWAVANWSIAVIATALASFSWPLMMMTALLPAVLAPATATGRLLVGYVATSLVVCTGVVLLGVLQDLSGLTAQTPAALQVALQTLFTPALAAMLGLIALHNSLRLQSALGRAVHAQDQLASRAEELRLSRMRMVAATDRERRRIERDLHDGAQQRLISIGIGLARARTLAREDPAAFDVELDVLRAQLHAAHDEIRALGQGLYPPVLTEHGLVEAIHSAVDRYPLPVTLDLADPGRHPAEVEATLYFCCVEALQNAAKYSAAAHVRVDLGADEHEVWFRVSDDGCGFDQTATGEGDGMENMRDRLGATGGELQVVSRPGAGTDVLGRVPVSSA